MKKYNNISEVWQDLEQGKTIYWANEGYKVFIQDARTYRKELEDFDKNHFSFKNGKVLDVRYIDTFWGSRMVESDLKELNQHRSKI